MQGYSIQDLPIYSINRTLSVNTMTSGPNLFLKMHYLHEIFLNLLEKLITKQTFLSLCT